jgi:arabinofuranosyltransferase
VPDPAPPRDARRDGAFSADQWPWALAVVAAVVLARSVARAWPFTVDDTFITLRYSRNVAEGLGPTFNATGPRAEGYTTFLWMLVLVVPHRLGMDPVAFAKGLGVAATFATLAVAARWASWQARAAGADRGAAAWAGGAAAACFATIPATAVHAVSGMETGLFTLLLTAMFATAGRVVLGRREAEVWLVAIALLLGLTRPEGNLAAFVAIATTAVLVPRARRPRVALLAALVWLVPVGLYELWRRTYYGLPFPLPFYVKLATPGLLRGLPDVCDWLRAPVLHFAVLVVAALVVRPPRPLRPAVATMAVLVAFFVLPQHQMGYDHRYLAPLDPSLAVLAGTGLARLLRVRWPGPRDASITFATFAVPLSALAALATGVALEAVGASAVLETEAAYGVGLARAHERLGRELLELGVPEGRLAISDAGAVPYFSRWWTLDLVGLNDATIATTGRRDPAWVLAQNPDVVVLASPSADHVEPWDWNTWEPALFDACLAAGFVRVGLRRFADDYWLWVLARPGSVATRLPFSSYE